MPKFTKAKKAAARTMTIGQAGYCAWKVANGQTCTKAEMAAALTTLYWGVSAVRSPARKKRRKSKSR